MLGMNTILFPSVRKIGAAQLLLPIGAYFSIKELEPPQGFLPSGGAYTGGFDGITAHFVRMERCVDDSLLHDVGDMETHWLRTIEFLELAGNNGVVVIAPSQYLDAITHFPTPSTITDIRSWFGLVNQVAHYAHLRNALEVQKYSLSGITS